MNQQLYLTNSLTRTKELFAPINPPFVGMYVCGPTVYGPVHLGHARPYVTFDVLFRYLKHLGYKVRYVRNITDVGHLEDEVEGTGEDRIQKRARLEKLEPMEIVKLYTDEFHRAMHLLNNTPPSIEPNASGHIIEQIEMIKKIIDNGFAYESNGSVYFDVIKYSRTNDYGKLSGRILEDLIAGAGNERRELEGQEEKHNPADFALWKKAAPEHIMRWNSPWGVGFPGWHIECSAMSKKYLGETFDIHGGGMDLLFPHHESEIAQSKGSCGQAPVKYWLHNNMITINGKKMGRSLNNFINLEQFFTGNHQLLEQAYAPMTIRFYMLQAHYRSTVDFSNEALQAAEKAFAKLMNSYDVLVKASPTPPKEGFPEHSPSEIESNLLLKIKEIQNNCFDAMNDDLNTAIVISQLFEATKIINFHHAESLQFPQKVIDAFKYMFDVFLFEILGLRNEKKTNDSDTEGLMNLILALRAEAKTKKDFATSDKIRDELNKLNFIIKDGKEGTAWSKQ